MERRGGNGGMDGEKEEERRGRVRGGKRVYGGYGRRGNFYLTTRVTFEVTCLTCTIADLTSIAF